MGGVPLFVQAGAEGYYDSDITQNGPRPVMIGSRSRGSTWVIVRYERTLQLRDSALSPDRIVSSRDRSPQPIYDVVEQPLLVGHA